MPLAAALANLILCARQHTHTTRQQTIPPTPPLLVLSPGYAANTRDARRLARDAENLHRAGARRLLLREPALPPHTLQPLVHRLTKLYGTDNLLLHCKTPGALGLARRMRLPLHLSSTLDWAAERRVHDGPLGVSVHSRAEVREAADLGMQWVFLSPLARPTSKPLDTRPTLGEDAIVCAQRDVPSLAVYALGGVTPAAATRLIRRGVSGVAVLGGVWTAAVGGGAGLNGDAVAEFVAAVEVAQMEGEESPR